jgi:multidrug transporter EmrE-like cation transporter
MRVALLVVCVLAFAVANAGSGILFKLAADETGRKALWRFIWGNLVGALGPVAMTLALKRANPNVVYALCYGGAFTLLQLLTWKMFHQPLSTPQWAGIACIAGGIVLLQIR